VSPRGRRAGGVERRVATIERRGRFLVAEPLFERGPRIALDRRARGEPGRIALVELGPGRAGVLRELGSPQRARDVVEALLWERIGWLGLRERHEREAADAAERARLLRELLGSVGEGTVIRPPFHCDYGAHIEIGARTFANFGLVALDVVPIRIGDDVQIGPYVQLLTATHPLAPEPRRATLRAR